MAAQKSDNFSDNNSLYVYEIMPLTGNLQSNVKTRRPIIIKNNRIL